MHLLPILIYLFGMISAQASVIDRVPTFTQIQWENTVRIALLLTTNYRVPEMHFSSLSGWTADALSRQMEVQTQMRHNSLARQRVDCDTDLGYYKGVEGDLRKTIIEGFRGDLDKVEQDMKLPTPESETPGGKVSWFQACDP